MSMQRREAHLVLNPAADRGRAGGRRGLVSRFLQERGVTPIWHLTRGPGHAGRIVGDLPGGSLVVAMGGDGTVHEVAAACVGRDLVVGVLPVGSGNDYVKALGVGADLGRALLLVSIQLAAAAGLLRIEQLYAVAFAVGVLAKGQQ